MYICYRAPATKIFSCFNVFCKPCNHPKLDGCSIRELQPEDGCLESGFVLKDKTDKTRIVANPSKSFQIVPRQRPKHGFVSVLRRFHVLSAKWCCCPPSKRLKTIELVSSRRKSVGTSLFDKRYEGSVPMHRPTVMKQLLSLLH